jgi:hypothetical protein
MSVAASGGIKRQVSLPLNKAIEFALQSVRIRFWRSMITAGGVFLGIAFLASVLTSKAIAGPNISAAEAARGNWLVGLSLMVCAVGITNSMLMSVTERFREIGTMKCLGALERFVVTIFMIEAAAMGVLSSTMGCLVGMLLIVFTSWVGYNPKDPAALPSPLGSLGWGDAGIVVLISIGVGTVLTMIATAIPAIQASRIPPAAALRTDV